MLSIYYLNLLSKTYVGRNWPDSENFRWAFGKFCGHNARVFVHRKRRTRTIVAGNFISFRYDLGKICFFQKSCLPPVGSSQVKLQVNSRSLQFPVTLPTAAYRQRSRASWRDRPATTRRHNLIVIQTEPEPEAAQEKSYAKQLRLPQDRHRQTVRSSQSVAPAKS